MTYCPHILIPKHTGEVEGWRGFLCSRVSHCSMGIVYVLCARRGGKDLAMRPKYNATNTSGQVFFRLTYGNGDKEWTTLSSMTTSTGTIGSAQVGENGGDFSHINVYKPIPRKGSSSKASERVVM